MRHRGMPFFVNIGTSLRIAFVAAQENWNEICARMGAGENKVARAEFQMHGSTYYGVGLWNQRRDGRDNSGMLFERVFQAIRQRAVIDTYIDSFTLGLNEAIGILFGFAGFQRIENAPITLLILEMRIEFV